MVFFLSDKNKKYYMNIISAFSVLLFVNCNNPKEKASGSNSINDSERKIIKKDISTTNSSNVDSIKEFKKKIVENKASDENQDQSNVIKYLPNNYSTKGNVDYTQELQKAFNENKNIVMPNFPIAVNYNGINVPSNRTIEFQSNSALIVLPNNKTTYQALLISEGTGIIINNPKLIGERDLHIGNTGEWGMGIKVLSSSNVTITNPKIQNFWGDGIYIGRVEANTSYCSDIKISGGVLDNNRRNGISIISGKNITIENMIIKNTNGTNPMAGIDLEPNLNDEYLYNINLNNIKTVNNKVDGIKIVFHKLTNKNNILINIDHHVDEGSQNPLTLVGVDNASTDKFSGILNYTNPKWSNANSNIRVQRILSPNLKLNINQININGKMLNKSIK